MPIPRIEDISVGGRAAFFRAYSQDAGNDRPFAQQLWYTEGRAVPRPDWCVRKWEVFSRTCRVNPLHTARRIASEREVASGPMPTGDSTLGKPANRSID